MRIFFSILFSLTTFALFAQKQQNNLSNWKERKAHRIENRLWVDSLPFFPQSIVLWNANKSLVAQNLYQVKGDSIILDNSIQDTVFRLRYRRFPYAIEQGLTNKDSSNLRPRMQEDILIGTRGDAYTYNPFTQTEDALQFGDLDYSGSFSRGVSVGNRQDLVLNSNFNLQVAGSIGDVEVTGSISDNNIPMQPEGNTQQLQDFDRIYLKFKLGKHELIGGDFDIKQQKDSYFLRYMRRLQGAKLKTGFVFGGDKRLDLDASFAVSKGKFARNTIQGQEGNQGPYRLKGNNNEQYIIIVAGTERVYIDGQLMERGADRDYIIDYNMGEVRFTNQQMITKDKRIRVEFSYTDFNFLRTLATTNLSYQLNKKTYLRFNLYSEQDVKGQNRQGALSDTSKLILLTAGDDFAQLYAPSENLVTENFDPTLGAYYLKRDTQQHGQLVQDIFVYASAGDSLYRVHFSAVEGGGAYVQGDISTNGMRYVWVGKAIDGTFLGTHAPVRALVAPLKKQLFNLGADYDLGKGGLVQSDLAWSNKDLNTFSEEGNADNQGLAARLTYRNRLLLKTDSLSKTYLNLSGHYEFLHQNFEQIDPYRNQEFQRDWNIGAARLSQEHIYRLRVGVENKAWGNVAYMLSGLNQDSLYNGLKQDIQGAFRYKGFNLKTASSWLLTQSPKEGTNYLRPNLRAAYNFKRWKVGIDWEQERNERRNADTLSLSSLYFNSIKGYINWAYSANLELKLTGTRRYDYAVRANKFQTYTIGDNYELSAIWKNSKHSDLRGNFNFRNLILEDSTLGELEAKQSYLGRLEYNLGLGKGLFKLTTIYSLGSGQQQEIIYNYVRVEPGLGTHIWVDNGDNNEALNEFFKAPFQDTANYLRVSVLTGNFIPTNELSFSQRLMFKPIVYLKAYKRKHKKKPIPYYLKALSKLQVQSSWRIERKTLAGAKARGFNPFNWDMQDSSLVGFNASIRNSLFINRRGFYAVDFAHVDSRNRILLNTGYDARSNRDYSLNQRFNLSRIPGYKSDWKCTAQLKGSYGEQSVASEYFSDRNYEIQAYEAQPKVTVIYQNKWRLISSYQWLYKYSDTEDSTSLKSHDVTTELHYNRSAKTNIKAKFSYIFVGFQGKVNTPLGFALLNGLQDGNNYMWTFSLNQRLGKNLQLTCSYEGRKTGEAKIVHIGRVQVRANF